MHRLIVLAFLLAIDAIPLVAEEPFPHERKIVELVQPYLDHKKVNALSIGVISKGRSWTKSFGFLDEAGSVAPSDKTLYEVGSISKVFTSHLLAEAIESGRLKLDDPIDTVLKELAKQNPEVGRTITFRHLSHHTSGLPVMPTNLAPADSTNPFADYNRAMLTEYMLSVKPPRLPGKKFEYSNLAVGLMGDLLSIEAGVGYEALLKQKLTEPLKMSDTVITLSEEQRSRFAPPHNAARFPDKAWDFDALVGCGGIRSSVDDMLLFAEASLHPPKGALGQTINLAWKEHQPARDGQFAMGLGWMIAKDGSTRWHNGRTGGYQAMILISRDAQCASVVLCNTAGAPTDALAEQIIQTLMGMNVLPRTFDDEFLADPQVAQRLEGIYQLAPGVVITVKVKEGRMTAQLTGQQFLPLNPKSNTEWKYQDVEATLKFELSESGPSSKVTLFQSGRELPSPRVPDAAKKP